MMGDYHVRFCERIRVRLPFPTRRAIRCSAFKITEPLHKFNLIPNGFSKKELLELPVNKGLRICVIKLS